MENERVGVIEAEMKAHFEADKVGFDRINRDTGEIKALLYDLSKDVKDATRRLHERIDAVAAEARSNANLALSAAQDASSGIKDAKIWALTGIGSGLVAALMWAADKMLGKG